MRKGKEASNKAAGKSYRTHSAAQTIRERIEQKGEGYWRLGDFSYLPPAAVAQAFSRLSRENRLQRVGKGLYYHARPTAFGLSRPSREKVLEQSLRQPLFAAGLTAASLLGFTTQNASLREYSTPANAIAPSTAARANIKVYTRRPESWAALPAEDAALLDFLRMRARTSDLTAEGTRKRMLAMMRQAGRFERLSKVAASEPPRVRALLGAIGQEIGASPALLAALRESLNPLSRFEFGTLRGLTHAKEWQAK